MPIDIDPADAAELLSRIEKVERLLGITPSASEDDDGRTDDGTIFYGGTGPWDGGAVVWRQDRSWAQIARSDPETIASAFAALSNPVRIGIVIALLDRSLSTAALGEVLDHPSTGQLHHHLRELLAAGAIYQPQRGLYALRHQHVVPLLTMLSACSDLAQVPA